MICMAPRKLKFTALQKANQSLNESLSIVLDHESFQGYSQAMQRTLMAGVIQNFEFVYELSIKMLKRQLKHDAASADEIEVLNYRDLIRTAAKSGLLDDPEAWFRYREFRNSFSHTYNEQKANEVFAAIQTFQRDARTLLENLEQRNA
jgi:nucleotidyltransferase substrate binding protein (TIGR01987 family)